MVCRFCDKWRLPAEFLGRMSHKSVPLAVFNNKEGRDINVLGKIVVQEQECYRTHVAIVMLKCKC